MAKSLRSKAVRKNKDAKRATVFKPVSDARTQRLAVKGALALAADGMDATPVDATSKTGQTGMNSTVSMFDAGQPAANISGKRGKWRRNREKVFSPYGIPSKEMRF